MQSNTFPASTNNPSEHLTTNIENNRKRKPSAQAVDALLVKALMDDKNDQKTMEPTDSDTDSLFCKSLIGQLKDLSPINRKKAKISIMQLLLEFEER